MFAKRSAAESLAGISQGVSAKLALICVFCLFSAASVSAQSAREQGAVRGQSSTGQVEDDQHCAIPRGEHRLPSSGVSAHIPDVELVDQNGRKLHFYSDLIKGKVVAINFVFTTCKAICPLQGASFSRVQAQLGDRLGRDVGLISVSIDPAEDTPERLKAWGAMFGARPGWTLLTGAKQEIDELVKAFTGEGPNLNDHSPVAFLVNDAKGLRIRAYSLGDAARWADLIAEVTSGSLSKSGR
jgi:protein SCO1/2